MYGSRVSVTNEDDWRREIQMVSDIWILSISCTNMKVPKIETSPMSLSFLDHVPLKIEEYRVRITVGGNRLSYEEDSGYLSANLLKTTIFINSVISDAKSGAQFMTADIKD